MMYGYNSWGMMGLFGGGIMMVLFWVLLVIFILWLVRELSGKGPRSRSDSDALEILKQRYARGEIDKKEFEEKKKDLEK